jgi:hypothetical protein
MVERHNVVIQTNKGSASSIHSSTSLFVVRGTLRRSLEYLVTFVCRIGCLVDILVPRTAILSNRACLQTAEQTSKAPGKTGAVFHWRRDHMEVITMVSRGADLQADEVAEEWNKLYR